MPKYVNRIAESIVSRVYTDKKNSKIVVFLKIADKEIEQTLTQEKVAKFLNLSTNIRNRDNKFAISRNIEQGIIRDIEDISKENGKYVYKILNLSPEEQYEELFENRQAIKFDLNDLMSNSVSNIVHLKDRFKEILGFNPEEGLCQPLIYFITLLRLKNRKDFAKLFKLDDAVSEQDFVAYINGKKEQTIWSLITQILLQCLPIFSVDSIERREGNSFYSDEVICNQEYDDLFLTEIWTNINQEQIKRALGDVEMRCYLEFSFCCYTYNPEDSDEKERVAHSTLVYKAENGKYIFFDPNQGVVGFCPNTGAANFTSEELCRAMELAIGHYSYSIDNVSDYYGICVQLRNATLMLKKAEELYETTEKTNSKIVDISVDRNTGNLLFTPTNI